MSGTTAFMQTALDILTKDPRKVLERIRKTEKEEKIEQSNINQQNTEAFKKTFKQQPKHQERDVSPKHHDRYNNQHRTMLSKMPKKENKTKQKHDPSHKASALFGKKLGKDAHHKKEHAYTQGPGRRRSGRG